ncbi:MAG TPA: ABC transporter permease [Vicinamibacterales bacterium]|nr:ABC transporter permease [Vicinamibacterales bacterium]
MSLDAFVVDLRHGLRALVRAPAYTASVVLVMALGIGANAAVFAALDQTVFRALPYRDPDRLVVLWEDFSAFGRPRARVSPQTFLDWRSMATTFDRIGAYGLDSQTLSGDGTPQEVRGARVTANLIPLLGVSPVIGRTFTADEERPGSGKVVISYRLWQGRYGGDAAIPGRVITMNGEPQQVVGVMPAGFDFPAHDTDFWIPLGLSPQILARRNSHFLTAVGRVSQGRTLEQAQDDMTAVAARLAKSFPATNDRIGVALVPLKEQMLGDTRTAFLILIGAAVCVLLIGCANVAQLVIARSSARRGAVAVRAALGASPLRIAGGVLLESMLIAISGALAGLIVARWTLAALQRMVPDAMSGFVALHIDGRVLTFAAAASMLSGLLFGVVPAIHQARTVLLPARGSIGNGTRRGRNALVIVEVAGALVLVVAAGLLIQTLWRLRSVDPGFRSGGMLTADVNVQIPKYQDQQRRGRFYTDVLQRVRAIPGVTAAGATSDLPYTSRGDTMSLAIEGRPAPAGAIQDVLFRLVSAGYLETIGARLVTGRLLGPADRADSLPVVVINETMARQYWPAENPLGHRVDTGTGDGVPRWMTIVGVVADVRERGLDLAMKPGVYVPFLQTGITFFQPSELAVRTTRAPLTIAKDVRDAVWSVDPDQAVSHVRTMDDIVDAELANRTQVLELLGAFAALALVLAAFGVYAVLSLLVSQRTREIGVRLALGASPQMIARSVVGYMARLAAAGILAGTLTGAAATRLLASLLYEITPLDSWTFGTVAIVIAGIALAASYLPARRAAMVDPIVTLREG